VHVVYFGRVEGTLPCEVIEPDLDELNDMSSGDEQERRFKESYERFASHDSLCMINLSSASAWSFIDNPAGAMSRCSEVRYTAPAMALLRDLKIPRIVVRTDIRNHPRNPEMTYHDWIRPRAVLDQLAETYDRTIQGYRYKVKSVWAGVETWAHLEQRANTGVCPLLVMGHPHVDDGTRRGDWSVWERLLPTHSEWPDWLQVYGAGWGGFPREMPGYMGCIDPESILDVTAQCVCAPLSAHSPGWLGTKANVLLSCGCVPIPIGKAGNPRRWDLEGRYAAEDDKCRVETWEELEKQANWLYENESLRQRQLEWWRERMKPNFDKLNQCIDHLLDGRCTESDSWFEDYGGYRL
jgi:hypothetical protein